MADQPSKARAGGFFLMLAIFAGAIAGVVVGQPSIGLLVGIGVGSVIAVGLWLSDRRRIGH